MLNLKVPAKLNIVFVTTVKKVLRLLFYDLYLDKPLTVKAIRLERDLNLGTVHH
jgi:hypothetical protein